VPSGSWHCIIDHIAITTADITFDLIWRRGATDMVLATWDQHFEPEPGSFDAQAYELDVPTPAISWEDGDKFVFRYTADAASQPHAWIPNSDGASANGRIPNFTLPR